MTGGSLRVLIVAGLAFGGGCIGIVDLSDDDETESSATGGSADASASSVTLSSAGSNSGTSGTASTSSAPTSGMDTTTSPVTTEPPTTTMEPTTESPTTDPPTTGGSTTETPFDCAVLGMKACIKADACLWEMEACQDNPCFDFDDPCTGIALEDCIDEDSCTFWGEGMDCYHHMCWPCHEIPSEGDCNEIQPCVWVEGDEICVHVD